MNTILSVVADVTSNQPSEMLFVEWDDMIEEFSTARPYPAFGNTVLPRCPHTRSFGFQTCCLQEIDRLGIELRVAIKDCVPIRAGFWKGLPQLLNHPFCRGMAGYVEVQDLPFSMFDDEEAVEQLERN